MSRRYLKRAMLILHEGRAVQMTPYHINDQTVDAEGDCDGQAFDSLNALIQMTQWNQQVGETFFARLREILAMR